MGDVRDDLPSGRIALLFTDIEGSTSLLQRLGPERYATLLARHHDVCRSIWAGHDGTVVDTAGDGFFVAFRSARQAVLAAVAAQEALAELDLAVRMGVHVAQLEPGPTGYVGLEVHRAARLAAAAHGGQVVVTDEVARATGDDILTLDLGRHRLKDIAGVTHALQVGDGDFPPLRTVFQRTLPVAPNPLLGRTAEVDDLVRRVLDGGRVVTVAGAAGLGKTRLALAAAERLADDMSGGAWWLPLATEHDCASALRALAVLLGVQDAPGGDLVDEVATRIGDERLLLVIDNAEHLLPDLALELSRLVAQCPHAALLVTSRRRLGIAAEQVVRLDALDPATAVSLYVARAEATGATVDDRESVARLCALLDHLPLAIELVAGRAGDMDAATVAVDLAHLLDGFAGPIDTDRRHRTLRAALEWSYDLLDPEQQRAFADLSVFVSGIDDDGARQVCGVPPVVLGSLVESGLLRRETTTGPPRWSMLRTVREFARDMAGQRLDTLLQSHARWVHEWVRALPVRNPLRLDSDAAASVARRRDEWRQALRTTSGSDPRTYAEIAASVWADLYFAGAIGEAVDILDGALLDCDDPVTRGLLIHGLVLIAFRMPTGRDVMALALEEVDLASGSGAPTALVDAWRSVGLACLAAGDDPGSLEACERSLALARSAGDDWGIGIAAHNIGNSQLNLGDFDAALEQFAIAGSMLAVQGDERSLMLARSNSIDALLALGRDDEALAMLPLVFDDEWVEQQAWVVDVIGHLALRRGGADDFVRLSAAASQAFDALEQPREGHVLNRHTAALAVAGAKLGPAGFARAEADGRSLDLDAAHAQARLLLTSWLVSAGGS